MLPEKSRYTSQFKHSMETIAKKSIDDHDHVSKGQNHSLQSPVKQHTWHLSKTHNHVGVVYK